MLRHRPESVGLSLGAGGWVAVDDLLGALARHGLPLTRADLQHVVATNDKQRFAIDPATDQIRAVQGHSVPVELGYHAAQPPPVLYHGTPVRNLAAIRREGLTRGRRHHVHLSPDTGTAARVGARRREPFAVLAVDAARMATDGHAFFRADNGVWLTEHVPPRYLDLPACGPPGS